MIPLSNRHGVLNLYNRYLFEMKSAFAIICQSWFELATLVNSKKIRINRIHHIPAMKMTTIFEVNLQIETYYKVIFFVYIFLSIFLTTGQSHTILHVLRLSSNQLYSMLLLLFLNNLVLYWKHYPTHNHWVKSFVTCLADKIYLGPYIGERRKFFCNNEKHLPRYILIN